jgi:transposase-like protein
VPNPTSAPPNTSSTPANSRLESLPADQRAALSLLLERGKSYAEIARLLGIPESTVRDRAHAALDAIGGDPVKLSPSPYDPAPPAESALADRTPPARLPRDQRAARPSSRVGGALLLAALVAAVVVAVILLTGGSHSHGASAGGKTPSTNATSGKGPTVSAKISLTSPDPASKAIGIVEVLAEGGQHAFYLAAEHLAPSNGFFYAVWLYNSSSSFEALGRSPNVGSNGRVAGGALLPANASEYHRIVLTRETTNPPHHPGPIVLSGAFTLGG